MLIDQPPVHLTQGRQVGWECAASGQRLVQAKGPKTHQICFPGESLALTFCHRYGRFGKNRHFKDIFASAYQRRSQVSVEASATVDLQALRLRGWGGIDYTTGEDEGKCGRWPEDDRAERDRLAGADLARPSCQEITAKQLQIVKF